MRYDRKKSMSWIIRIIIFGERKRERGGIERIYKYIYIYIKA